MKVYVLVSGTALPGKYRGARNAVTATVAYLNENGEYAGKYDAICPLAGPNNQVGWMCRYGSLAEYESENERRRDDPEWRKVFDTVRQTVDLDGIMAQILEVLDP